MARSHARMQFGMWRHDGHDKASKDARLLYMTILLDETLNQVGVVRLSMDMWAEDAAMTRDEADVALDELRSDRFVVVDGYELLVRTFVRNDGVADQPNILRNALDVARHIRSPVLRRAVAEELRKLPPALPAKPTKSGALFVYPDPHAVADELDPDGSPPTDGEHDPGGSANPSRILQQNPSLKPFAGRDPGTPRGRGRGRGGSSPSEHSSTNNYSSTIADAPGDQACPDPPPEPDPRPDAEELCVRLRDRIVGNDLKPPTITDAWRRDARLLLDRDGRDHDQALRLIDWCQADEFWHANILSMAKFRKQYDQLLAKARTQQRDRSRARPSPTGSAAEATRASFQARRQQSNVHQLPYANGT